MVFFICSSYIWCSRVEIAVYLSLPVYKARQILWLACASSTLWFSIKRKLRNKEMGGDAKVFTFEDVTVHNKPKDCWLIINGKVRSFIEFSWKICSFLFFCWFYGLISRNHARKFEISGCGWLLVEQFIDLILVFGWDLNEIKLCFPWCLDILTWYLKICWVEMFRPHVLLSLFLFYLISSVSLLFYMVSCACIWWSSLLFIDCFEVR